MLYLKTCNYGGLYYTSSILAKACNGKRYKVTPAFLWFHRNREKTSFFITTAHLLFSGSHFIFKFRDRGFHLQSQTFSFTFSFVHVTPQAKNLAELEFILKISKTICLYPHHTCYILLNRKNENPKKSTTQIFVFCWEISGCYLHYLLAKGQHI